LIAEAAQEEAGFLVRPVGAWLGTVEGSHARPEKGSHELGEEWGHERLEEG